jgi:GNAT superfamily N-acetyltransferase
MSLIVPLDNSTEAFDLAKQVFEQFVFPTFSEEGKKTFSEHLKKDIEAGFLNPEFDFYGIRSHGILIGYVALKKKSHIFHLCVIPNEQKRGIGKMLLEYVEKKSKKAGSSQLTVNASLNAIPFYQKCGFETNSAIQERSGIRFQPMEKVI